MNVAYLEWPQPTADKQFARCVAASKRVSWDIDADVLRGRTFDLHHKFLPDGLTKIDELNFLSEAEQRYLSQIQGRTYANMFGLVERFIGAKVLEITQDYALGDQVALEALVRFGEEELKHQELFRRVERMIGDKMADGYKFPWQPNEVAAQVLSRSTWAVMALTLHIELFTQLHFRDSVEPDRALSPLFKDVLLYHWREECQHATLDELEWRRIDRDTGEVEREVAVDDFIELVQAVDAILVGQATLDADYFERTAGRAYDPVEQQVILDTLKAAYRWQYILSGAGHPKFLAALEDLATLSQQERISEALRAIA